MPRTFLIVYDVLLKLFESLLIINMREAIIRLLYKIILWPGMLTPE
jgi:hypothetical protein